MNTNQPTNIIINAEYFRNRFKKHDAAIKELMDLTVKKISSRKKRDYQEAFLKTN